MVHGARAPSFHCGSVPVACTRSFVCLESRRRWGRPNLGSYYDCSDVTGVSCTMNKHSKGSSISATNFTAARGRNGPELENRFSACSETNILVVNVAQRRTKPHSCSQTWTELPYLRTHGICRCHCGVGDSRFQLGALANLSSVLAKSATFADTRATCSARMAERCPWKSFRLVGQPVPSHNYEVVREVWCCL